MGECTGCGDCCDCIKLQRSKTNMLTDGKKKDRRDVKWLRGLIPVRRAEARERFSGTGKRFQLDAYYYDCPNFDREKRSCMIHETDDFPPVCSGYPWYNNHKDPHEPDVADVPVRCSFVEDAPTFIAFIPFRSETERNG